MTISLHQPGLGSITVRHDQQRMKEIGVRKVSGASAWSIILLISKGYSFLIFIAFLLAAPLAYTLMETWLQDFAYRVTPSITCSY